MREGFAEPDHAGADGVTAEGAVARGGAFDLFLGELGHARWLVADGAAVGEEAAVEVGDVWPRLFQLVECALVEVVDVLRGDMEVDARPARPLSDPEVAGVWLRAAAESAAPEVPGEHGFRIAGPGVDGGHRLWVDVGPDAGLGVTESVQSGILAHARAGENFDVAGLADGADELLREEARELIGGGGGWELDDFGHGSEGSGVCELTQLFTESISSAIRLAKAAPSSIGTAFPI